MFIFLLFYVTGVEKWNLFFFQIMILEHLHFCLTNHACVSHLLHGQPHLLEWYYRNCLIGTHVSTSSIRMINFFTLQCECSKVVMFQIMPALCPHGQGGEVVNQMWTSRDRGRGSLKFSNLYGHPVWMTPILTIQLLTVVLVANIANKGDTHRSLKYYNFKTSKHSRKLWKYEINILYI